MRKFLLVAFALIIFSTLLFQNKVQAATITPTKYYYDIDPGQTKSDELKVLADALQPGAEKLYVYAMGMRKVGEEDDREFYIPDPNDKAEPANWLTISKSEINLDAGDTVSVPFSITVNSVAKCGTNLATIFVSNTTRGEFQANKVDTGTVVGLKNSLVAQIHINVKGAAGYCDEVKTKLELLDFKLDSPTFIFNYDHIPFETRIKNDGNLLSQSPKGYIELFGSGPKITLDFNDENLDIYPGTVRKFKNEWIDADYPQNGTFIEQTIYELSHFRFGQYEARLGVTFNVNPKIVSTVNVWIIPWKILVIVLGFIAIVVFVILRDRKHSTELKKFKKDTKKK